MLDNIYFYNDSKATNVAATCSALESFNKVILIAGGSQKGESFKPLLKFSNKVYEAYLIGETAKDIKKVLEKNCKSFICQSLEEAVLLSYKKNTSLRKSIQYYYRQPVLHLINIKILRAGKRLQKNF